MSVALCKCGYQRGQSPNPWYAVIENANSNGRTEIERFSQSEIGFSVVKYFDSSEAAYAYARENGMPFPHGNL